MATRSPLLFLRHVLVALRTARPVVASPWARLAVFVLCGATLAAQPGDAVAHWPFDEGSGAKTTDVGGKYPAALTSTSWVGGQVGPFALVFNGAAYAVTPPVPVGAAFTVSAWVNPNVIANDGGFVRIAETNASSAWMLGVNTANKKFKFIVNSGAGSTSVCQSSYGCVEGGAANAGAWQLVTGTFDGQLAKLYVDGILVSTDTAVRPPTAEMPVFFGASYVYNYNWTGGIDDVLLYNRALSAAEVVAIFNAVAGGRLPAIQIKKMLCRESMFLEHNTRALTCSMKSDNKAWTGFLSAELASSVADQPPLHHDAPIDLITDGDWALTAIGLYKHPTEKLLGVSFYGARPNAEWVTPSGVYTARPSVGKLTIPCPLNVPCPMQAPLIVREMKCEIAKVEEPMRSVTCGIAGDQQAYSGTLKVRFDDDTSDDQRVAIQQPYVDQVLTYWGVTAVAVEAQKTITSVEFWADMPVATWDPNPPEPYPYPPPPKKKRSIWCRWFGWGCPK